MSFVEKLHEEKGPLPFFFDKSMLEEDHMKWNLYCSLKINAMVDDA